MLGGVDTDVGNLLSHSLPCHGTCVIAEHACLIAVTTYQVAEVHHNPCYVIATVAAHGSPVHVCKAVNDTFISVKQLGNDTVISMQCSHILGHSGSRTSQLCVQCCCSTTAHVKDVELHAWGLNKNMHIPQ